MTSRLEVVFEADGVSRRDVRAALEGLTDDDLSVSSPISPGGREAGVAIEDGDVVVRVEGHDGDWTRKSTRAVVSAVESVDGVVESAGVDGGYNDPGDSEDGSDESNDS